MKTIVAFILGATIVGVSSGVLADTSTYNEENGYWGSQCPVVYGVRKVECDPEVSTFMEENGYWS